MRLRVIALRADGSVLRRSNIVTITIPPGTRWGPSTSPDATPRPTPTPVRHADPASGPEPARGSCHASPTQRGAPPGAPGEHRPPWSTSPIPPLPPPPSRAATRDERPVGDAQHRGHHRHVPRAGYIADRSLATAVFLGLELGRPLLLEGEAGVGKTELAKVLATSWARG